MISPQRTWWGDANALTRFVCDLVAGQLAQLQGGRALPPLPWDRSLPLDERGIGADSLDRLKLATALGEAIHLQRTGIEDTLLAQTTIGDWIDVCAQSLARFDRQLTFATSGSTGGPKWYTHTLDDLQAEVEVLAGRLASRQRIIAAVPSHHIYGFIWTVLLPARLGAAIIDVRASSPARLAGMLRAGDVIVAHPAYWTAFARAVPMSGADVTGVSSTAPCPGDVVRAVRATGIDAFVEMYGSTETAGIGWRWDPVQPYRIFDYWRRGDDEDELVRRRSDGTDQTLRGPDVLVWEDERHVRPAGRREGAVQVGGHNVFPARVCDVLRAHPEVADAAVRLMRPDEGDRLKAFVVPRDPSVDHEWLGRELWSWNESRLMSPERPRSITIGPSLPTGALGKTADWPIQ